jgi:hypothetical protein
MTVHKYAVGIGGCTQEQADGLMARKFGGSEGDGFEYVAVWQVVDRPPDQYPISYDGWQAAVTDGNTMQGFSDWVAYKGRLARELKQRGGR